MLYTRNPFSIPQAKHPVERHEVKQQKSQDEHKVNPLLLPYNVVLVNDFTISGHLKIYSNENALHEDTGKNEMHRQVQPLYRKCLDLFWNSYETAASYVDNDDSDV